MLFYCLFLSAYRTYLRVFLIEEKEECIEFILSEIKSNNPQEIAHTILEKVLEVSKQTRGDDMTVLVAGIWEKH